MSFDLIKATNQRKAFTILEIILDINDPANDATYAMQPDSYGTPKTTDDITAYTGVDFRTYRYADQQIFGVDHFPFLEKVSTTEPKIDPGKSMGMRATASATLKDFISNDTFELTSAYADRRVEGSHVLKLLARNHYKNRRARVIRGFNPDAYSEANCTIESYVIDSISYPSEQGSWSVKMIDELILTEEVKAKAPTVSEGELSAGITDVATTLSFTTPVAEEYGAVSATGHIAIEKEIMSYTVATTTTMTIVRAQAGTTAKAHSALETIQKCLVFDNVNIIDIITTLITDHTRIPASFIPTADWATLKAGDLSSYNLTRYLFKPEDVKKLLNELIQIAGLSSYVDVINNEIKLIAVPDFANPVIDLVEGEHLLQGSVKVVDDYKKQVTRQAIWWDKFDATESKEKKNYRKRFTAIDGIVEAPADIDNISEPKPLVSDWLGNSVEDNQIGTGFAQRQINRFSQPPKRISFDLDQRYIGNVAGGFMGLGSIFTINTSRIKDGGLNNVTTTCQCVSMKSSSKDGQYNVTGLSYIASTPPNADLYITTDKTDYLLTDELTDTTEAREYVVVINAGVQLGSSTTANFGFSQGAFTNAGATLKLVILGQIYGAGGAGGTGGDAGPDTVSCAVAGVGSGLSGGDAINLTTDAIIDNGFGIIYAGGGGGEGMLGECIEEPGPVYFGNGGDGGGGGQGLVGGGGGVGGLATGAGGGVDGVTGENGSIGAPGSNGGTFGVDGDGVGGGSSGLAIKTNGNTVTITAGNNSLQILGAVV